MSIRVCHCYCLKRAQMIILDLYCENIGETIQGLRPIKPSEKWFDMTCTFIQVGSVYTDHFI